MREMVCIRKIYVFVLQEKLIYCGTFTFVDDKEKCFRIFYFNFFRDADTMKIEDIF